MKILTQLALIFGLCLAGEAIAAVLPIPFPGSVLAMLLLLGLLLCGALKERQVNDAGGWLLDNMSFFFLPPSVALLEQYQLLAGKLWQFLAVCVLSTLATFFAAFAAVSLTMKLMQRRAGK